jgi:hypothetical protein
LVLVSEDTDPTGLGGHRYVRNEKAKPYIVELWGYPTTISFETIREAWLKVLPRAKHMTGFRAEGIRGGRRLVTIDAYIDTPKPATPQEAV